MLNWQIACIALSLSLLLLASGCFTQKEDTALTNPLTSCTSRCENSFPHTVGEIDNGTCTCFCEKGYQRQNGTCVKYTTPTNTLASCDSTCKQKFQNSFGKISNGTCTCPCRKGYVSYNRTCITPSDFEDLAPVLCSKEYPVLKIYDWTFKEKNNYIYLCYKNESKGNVIEDRRNRYDYWNFVGDPYSNSSVSFVTDMLMNISKREGFGKYEQVEFAISFVQSLPYTYDNVTTPYNDYPRFPYETIYADGGDCEDTSILLAAILKKMGYDVVLLHLPGHVATGVYCTPSDFNYTIASYPNNGRDYCYIETASGQKWKVGELPEPHIGAEVNVIPLRSAQPDIYLGWGQASYFQTAYSYNSRDTYVNVTNIRIDNFGTVPAKNVKIYVALEAVEEGQVWDQYTYTVGDIPVRGAYSNFKVTNLNVPTGKSFRVDVAVYGDNFQSVEKKSGWITWN